jgi:hypothetical protein
MKVWPRTDTDSREMLLEYLHLRGLKVHAAPNGVTAHAAIEATNSIERGPIHNIRTVKYVIANGVLHPTAKLWESVGLKP